MRSEDVAHDVKLDILTQACAFGALRRRLGWRRICDGSDDQSFSSQTDNVELKQSIRGDKTPPLDLRIFEGW
jgi:hypothetical protein